MEASNNASATPANYGDAHTAHGNSGTVHVLPAKTGGDPDGLVEIIYDPHKADLRL